ncbi:hypothetical protein BASA61_008734 [Batrachochytrium salamandrivorans]|nr:hypothetical protein BASA61_008734 [Batrachochytrium salamandrivorans]
MDDDLFGEDASDDGSDGQSHAPSEQDAAHLDTDSLHRYEHQSLPHATRYSDDDDDEDDANATAVDGNGGGRRDHMHDEDNLFGDESDEEPGAMSGEGDAFSRYHDRDGSEEEDAANLDREVVPDHPEILFVLKLPNFLNINSVPYDRTTYTGLGEDSEGDSEKARERARLHVENTIRWRYDANQQDQKNSNARLVRWADNSFSLLLGEELFEVAVTSLRDQHHYLALQHSQENYVQNRARFSKAMSFRPYSTQSLTHKKVTMAIVNMHTKQSRTKLISTTEDPEKAKLQVEKAENERLKARRKLESKRSSSNTLDRGSRGRYYDGSDEESHYRSGNRNMADTLRARRYDYLDDEEEEEDDDFVVADDAMDDDENDRRRSTKLMEAKSFSRSNQRPVADFDDDSEESALDENSRGAAETSLHEDASSHRKRRHIVDSDNEE